MTTATCCCGSTSGAPGVLIASQISAGARNGLTLSVYGEKGGLTLDRTSASTELTLDWLEAPSQVLHAGFGLSGRRRPGR